MALFNFQATFAESPKSGTKVPSVRITLPDGALVASDQREISQILSRALSRTVTFEAANRVRREGAAPLRADNSTAKAEEYWLDIEGLDHRDTVTDFTLPEGTFFDTAVVHVLTTATLNRLRELYPQGALSPGDSDLIWWCRLREANGLSSRMVGLERWSQLGTPFA